MPVTEQNRSETLLHCFEIRRFGEERVGNRLIELNRLVICAAGLDAVAEMVDYVWGHDAVEGDWFIQPVLFPYVFHFFGVRPFVFTLVENLCGRAIVGGELVFDPEAIRI